MAKGSPIDQHAAAQTATLYTGVHIFPMLPEALSTGATSLLEDGDKLGARDRNRRGAGRHRSHSSDIYRAVVRNKAKLAYDGVGAWLEGRGPAPAKVAASADLQAQLKLQDQVAQTLCKARHEHGALNIETIEIKPVMDGDRVVDVARQDKSRATELIEDFMIAANGVDARFFETHKRSSLRRVVRTPKRWDAHRRPGEVDGDDAAGRAGLRRRSTTFSPHGRQPIRITSPTCRCPSSS